MRKAALFVLLPVLSTGMAVFFAPSLSAATYDATTAQSTAPSPTPCPTTVVDGHPTDCQGYVVDGSPQHDDGHCIGNPSDRVSCVVARRPECIGHSMSYDEAMTCWAPALNQFGPSFPDVNRPWSPSYMLNVLFCESRGNTTAKNGQYHSLLQEGNGSFDAAQNIIDGHDQYYVPSGTRPWECKG